MGFPLPPFPSHMNIIERIANWLETHWITPAYSGWVLVGILYVFLGSHQYNGWVAVRSEWS
jgi:hypothetical protein